MHGTIKSNFHHLITEYYQDISWHTYWTVFHWKLRVISFHFLCILMQKLNIDTQQIVILNFGLKQQLLINYHWQNWWIMLRWNLVFEEPNTKMKSASETYNYLYCSIPSTWWDHLVASMTCTINRKPNILSLSFRLPNRMDSNPYTYPHNYL